MNYARFQRRLIEFADELVREFGIPRDAAEQCTHYTEIIAIRAECDARAQGQLVIDYRKHGPTELARARRVSRETLRRKYNAAVATKSPHMCGTQRGTNPER